jgi:hypothetical protein
MVLNVAFVRAHTSCSLLDLGICSDKVQSILKDLKSELPEDLVPLIDTVSNLHNYGTDGDAAIIDGVTGDEEMHLAPNESRPFIRANREKLRALLATNLDVEYDKYFQRYEETASGITAYFADGTVATGDILVGADGAHSVGKTETRNSREKNKMSKEWSNI